ncbi:MAG: right-handed parallel beta-helix repeat-containing protein [Acidobacteriota bacterium]
MIACLFLGVAGCAVHNGPAGGPASPAPTPTPGPAAVRAVENPPDVRARMPLRPTPPQPESRFPPPQQSEADEKRAANDPREPELLTVETAVFLDGRPFPEKTPYDPKFPEARRLRYVAVDAVRGGNGSFEKPWNDLQQALCGLEPGDRLVLASGIYAGSFKVAGPCRAGTAEAPIQVFSRHAFLKPSGAGDVLTVQKPHWQFWEVQIALLDSESAGFVTSGPEAHDIALDQSHVYEGKGPAVRLEAGSSRVTLSNCHIHQSTGVRVDAGTSDVTLIGNHIHHNRAASITVGEGGSAEPASGITITANRLHNDRGPGLSLFHCARVRATRNKFSNYRAEEDRGGEAVWIGPGADDVRLEENTILEASIGIRVAAPVKNASASEIAILRNYFDNRLTDDAVALVVEGGRGILFAHDVVDRYSEGFRVGPGGAGGLSVVNSLFVEPATAFEVPAAGSLARIEGVVFGGAGGARGMVGGRPVDAKVFPRGARVVPRVELVGRDLGKITGFSPVDAGSLIPGALFQGSAPDIGIAER